MKQSKTKTNWNRNTFEKFMNQETKSNVPIGAKQETGDSKLGNRQSNKTFSKDNSKKVDLINRKELPKSDGMITRFQKDKDSDDLIQKPKLTYMDIEINEIINKKLDEFAERLKEVINDFDQDWYPMTNYRINLSKNIDKLLGEMKNG